MKISPHDNTSTSHEAPVSVSPCGDSFLSCLYMAVDTTGAFMAIRCSRHGWVTVGGYKFRDDVQCPCGHFQDIGYVPKVDADGNYMLFEKMISGNGSPAVT